jgi:hypothetical protein
VALAYVALGRSLAHAGGGNWDDPLHAQHYLKLALATTSALDQWALSITEPQLIRRLGYIVDPPRNPAFAPVYWRQAHWVYLDGGATVLDVYGKPGITPQRGLWNDHGQAG